MSLRTFPARLSTALPVALLAATLRVASDHGLHLPSCPFRALTGLDCPGCGSTRSALALTRLDLTTALDYNLLFPLTVLALTISWFVWVLAPTRSLTDPLRHRFALRTYVVLLALFWVLRLLPTPLGAYLASTPS
jgi:hypothetical protein